MKVFIHRLNAQVEEIDVPYGFVKVLMPSGIVVDVSVGPRDTSVAVQPPTFYQDEDRLARLHTEVDNINGVQAHFTFRAEPRP